MQRGVLDHQEAAGEADVDDSTEILDRQLGDQPERAEAGGVDHDVERTGVAEQGPHRVLVGDVDRGGAVRITEFGCRRTRSVGVAVGDGHPAAGLAVFGQCLADRLADTRCATDDHGIAVGHVWDPLLESGHLAWMTPHGSA